MAEVQPIPEGYHSVTPYLIVDGAADAIEYYGTVFGATERMRMAAPGDKIGHAELDLGDSVVMLADEFPDMGFRSPKSLGGAPVTLHLYVDDVDAVFDAAVQSGSEVLEPVEDKFYGDRSGQVRDPFGHVWSISTHVEDIPDDEMARRAQAYAESMS